MCLRGMNLNLNQCILRTLEEPFALRGPFDEWHEKSNLMSQALVQSDSETNEETQKMTQSRSITKD